MPPRRSSQQIAAAGGHFMSRSWLWMQRGRATPIGMTRRQGGAVGPSAPFLQRVDVQSDRVEDWASYPIHRNLSPLPRPDLIGRACPRRRRKDGEHGQGSEQIAAGAVASENGTWQ